MCAVYAFMRHADDLSDDEDLPPVERLDRMRAWMEEWRRAAAGGATDDPVFIALRDVQQRFGVAGALLDQLVQGTMMDLTTQPGQAAGERETLPEGPLGAPEEHAFIIYRTFDDLYRYCYYVASVVGLVCVRIFGYSGADAEKLAERTGIAFQLTNILRDVKEDLARGRVYLPLEDLRRYDLTVEQLASIQGNGPLELDVREMLEMEARRALEFYAAGDALVPMISPDSRAALWVLIAVYRRLLEHIVARDYQVFSAKIKVPVWEKFSILLRGLWMALRARLSWGTP
jgi:phytoene synthase